MTIFIVLKSKSSCLYSSEITNEYIVWTKTSKRNPKRFSGKQKSNSRMRVQKAEKKITKISEFLVETETEFEKAKNM